MRILIADDEQQIRVLLASMLRRWGHTVQAAEDGEAAWAAIEAAPHGFDLILSDFKMPRLDGLGLLQRLRARGHTVPFVFMTGFLDRAYLESEAVQPTAILDKPFSFAKLQASISALASAQGGCA